jgi:hypothetical protein
MKKYDSSLFSSNVAVKGKDFRNVTFNSENDEDGDKYYNSITTADGTRQYGCVESDNDNNPFYIPQELRGISTFEAKVRVINNEIDNYTNAANANIRKSSYYSPIINNQENPKTTDAMVYMDSTVGQKKRKETISNMESKPDDYAFVGKVFNGVAKGFLGVDGTFVENWGAPVDTSKVKYYDDLEECVSDSVMFNYKNSSADVSRFATPNVKDAFIAVEKSDLPKLK